MRKTILFFVLSLLLTVVTPLSAAPQKTIVVYSSYIWPPMEYLQSKNKPAGFSLDLLKELGAVLHVKFQCKNVLWENLFSELSKKNCDMLSSSITITSERSKSYLFSDPYCEIRQAVISRKKNKIHNLDGLNGLRVGGQIATTGVFLLEEANITADIKEYDDINLAMQALKKGELDAVICDSNVASYYVRHKKYSKDFSITFTTENIEEIAFCFHKDNVELQQQINQGLAILRKNGKLDALTKKWMGK